MKLKITPSPPLLIGFITLCAFAVRVIYIETRTLTIDEASSLKWIAGQSGWYLYTHYHTNTHPLIAILAHFSNQLGFGDWLTFYRWPSFVGGLLAIPLTYQLGQRMLGPWQGLLGATLLAVAPFHLDFSIQMRGYALMTASALAVYLATWQLTQTYQPAPRRRLYWLALSGATLVGIYSHFLGLLPVGVSWLLIGYTYLFSRNQRRKPFSLTEVLTVLSLFILGFFILYGPILPRMLATPDVETDWPTHIEPLFVDNAFNGEAVEDYLKVFRLYGPVGEPQSVLVWSFVLLAGMGLAAMFFNQPDSRGPYRRAGRYSLIWIFTPILGMALGLQFIPGFYAYRRFFLFLQPLYLLCLAHGIYTLGVWLSLLTKRLFVSHLTSGLILLLAFFGATQSLTRYFLEDTAPVWFQVAQIVTSNEKPAFVICEPYARQMRQEATHRDECHRNLEFYLQPDVGQPVPWLSREIDIVATIPGLQNYPDLESQAGQVSLVLWQTDEPLPPLTTLNIPPELTIHQIDGAIILQATSDTAQLFALIKVVDGLLLIETSPADQFSYYLAQAQLQAVIGEREQAKAALFAARQLSPPNIDAEGRLQAVSQLIGVPLE